MPETNTPPKATAVAASLKTQASRLQALLTKLEGLGDAPVPASVAKELDELATAIRRTTTPAPPSTTTEKADGWPRDMANEDPGASLWGEDPEGLRLG